MKRSSRHIVEQPVDFYISLDCADFPIEYSPCRANASFIIICLEGVAEIEIDMMNYSFVKNDILELFPGQILACNEKSHDFKIAYLTFSNQTLDEVLYRLPADFIGYLKETVRYHLQGEECDELMSDYFVIMNKLFLDVSNISRREMVLNLLHNFYLNLYSKVVQNNKLGSPKSHRKRKKELQDEFFRLIKENTNIREVSYFAGRMCITPKYLSIVTKETVGSSAKDLIDKFAVTELKLRLRSTSVPLKEIADMLNYPNEGFLCKFFKKHTGVTPSHYRGATSINSRIGNK